jgi:hypothetical protein
MVLFGSSGSVMSALLFVVVMMALAEFASHVCD